jgi:hypothetical protein
VRLNFRVRSDAPAANVIGAIRRETAAIDRGMLIFDSMPMTEYVAVSLHGAKVGAVLLNVRAEGLDC